MLTVRLPLSSILRGCRFTYPCAVPLTIDHLAFVFGAILAVSHIGLACGRISFGFTNVFAKINQVVDTRWGLGFCSHHLRILGAAWHRLRRGSSSLWLLAARLATPVIAAAAGATSKLHI